MPYSGLLSRGLLLCNIWAVAAASAPYVPTHIFTSHASNTSFALVLQPKGDQTGVELLSLNLSTINASSPQYTVLYNDVPFSSADNDAFVPMSDSNGSLTVFTGNCQASQNASPMLWTFQPDNNSSIGNGTWVSSLVNGKSTAGTTNTTTGPGYLARGFGFGSSNDTRPDYYTFGGMCPFDNSTQADWMSAAEYSNQMTMLAQANSSSEFSGFIEQQSESSNSPIAEAGYTITPLQMTSSTTTGGKTVQQENFLFIGGNTQSAFLNMSTLALFSLPEASWTYISVSSEAESSRTDLAIRDDNQIEPRSGHSAVASLDGSQIIVFGGWVGDTSTPAEPQLLVLDVGEDYGGSGEWSWSTPEPTGSGPAIGSGIYGHATTMLPGNVMMISGGYVIPSTTTTSKRESSTSLQASSQVYLYNLTSNAWMFSYTSVNSSNSNTGSGPLATSGEKAGLGVGVSAGAIAVVCAGYFFWSRKRWRNRRRRDQELRKLALGAERSNIWSEPGLESSYRGDAALRNTILENLYNPGPSHHYSAVPPSNSSTEAGVGAGAEGSGLLYEVPSPPRGLRRSLSNRPQRIQSALWYEDNRISYGTGSIHPIDEREEFEMPPEQSSEKDPESESSKNSSRFSDPFVDPPSPTRVVATVAFHEKTIPRQQESTASASVREGKTRAISPEKNDRTHSDLSDSSRSGISELSIQRSDFASQRPSTHLFQSAIPTLEPSSSLNYGNSTASGRSSPEKASLQAIRAEILDSGMRWPFEQSDSFSTSSSPHKRSRSAMEGDTLLGSGPEWSTPPESPTRLSQTDRESKHSSSSGNNNNSNSLTWMGSIRKTLSTARRAVLGNNLDDEAEKNPAMLEITSPVDFDDESLKLSRRASNASDSNLRRKQGPKDWAVEGTTRNSLASSSLPSPARRCRRRMHEHENNNNDDNDVDDAFNDDMDIIDPDYDNDDDYGEGDGFDEEEDNYSEDWDVEAAAEGRLVQITYTVPKEKLRVVNAGVGDRVIGDADDDDDDVAAPSSAQVVNPQESAEGK
ncbi:hypothetical protein UA08_05638 [Talaromyces atroroseus]|uniref:Galactose oxidase n=1 Tax=Talaromyces atroroseus TaxID=1441469 RepID=A0A225ACR9_TALAT|nr:hypothetical protein UA08_05638 [Talaromyces atroroseus]OKL58941.1 hypothetical protein UA08_05638 [Talaromyces atroroseus]